MSLLEDARNIQRKDPAARSVLEVILLYPGFHILVYHRIAHWLYEHGHFFLARWVSQHGRHKTGIEIHPGAQIGRCLFIDHGMGIVIGETAEVGDDCTIYQGVTLGGTSLERGAKRHPTLEAGVIVGGGAKVLGSFTVGAGAKIGSNAVVVKPVPAGATAVGNPAHIVGSKPKETQSKETQQPATPAFSGYGVNTNEEDPITQTLKTLMERLERAEATQAKLAAQLQVKGDANQ